MTYRTTAAAVLAIGILAVAAAGAQETPTPFGTTVEVRRIVTEVRVVDYDGSPVLGLGPDDFKVKVDGDLAEVESVLWIPSTAEAVDAEAARVEVGAIEDRPPRPPEGRLIVVLFQVDYAPRPSRTVGLVRMARRASEFVADLGPGDKVAVLVFSSHLQLRADFTDDHETVAEMVRAHEVLHGKIKSPGPADPSLAAHLDREEAKDAASMDQALELIGKALQQIPGTKSLVLFGYALGTMSAGHRITIDDGYREAMEALSEGRTSVFSLDVTDADWHSLEIGLRAVAEDTGGFYVRTHLFPDFAMDKLVKVISSYYELSILPPPDVDDEYTIKVSVKRPKTDVYVRQDHASSAVW